MKSNPASKTQLLLHARHFLLLILFFALTVKGYSQNDKLNQLINDRNDLLNQYDVYSKTDKAFKNKKSIADYQALIKRIIDLDAQIIGQSSYALDQANKSKDDAIKKLLAHKPGSKVVVSPASDSLMEALSAKQNEAEYLNTMMKVKGETVSRLTVINDSLLASEKRLAAKLKVISGDNESLNQKNLLLIIFNLIVIVVLIIFLVYVMRKPSAGKKTPVAQTKNAHTLQNTFKQPVEVKREEPVIKISSDGIMHSSHDSIDNKLDQIEKLAKLRDKGYLTDDEFSLQKRQILGN